MKILRLAITTLLLTVVGISSRAESLPVGNLPIDPEVRMGQLDNSLTYYIRHNQRPKGQADFYIYSDVGAIQEEDDQQGLAHFMEHMAFNGTKNFPGKQIINYLESIGVKFGANLNAYTSWDNTVYMMQDVPTLRPSVIDSALLILHDWAGLIEPQPEEIDKERGVIKEELRTRDGADWRSTIAMIETIAGGSKYEERNLIGTLEGLDGFEHNSLTSFYHEWYRPDYQAIIIVGDVDVNHVESKLKELFSQLPAAAEDAPQKEKIYIDENIDPIVGIYTDPENRSTSIQYIIKKRADDRSEMATYAKAKESVEESLIGIMQNERIYEITKSKDSPLLYGGMGAGMGIGIIPTLETTFYTATSSGDKIEAAFERIVTEMERTRRHGFTENELERARINLLRSAEKSYLNRNDRTNSSYVQEYMSHYKSGTPIPSAEDSWRIDSMLISEVTLAEINSVVPTLFDDKNNVIMITAPSNVATPSEERVVEIIKEVRSSEIEPYVDSSSDASLMPEGVELKGSPIVSSSYNEDLETQEWTLANGIKVLFKPTTLKSDEVIMKSYSEGGLSLFDDNEYVTAMLLPSTMGNSGIGEHSAIELGKLLTGKSVGVGTWVDGYSHGVSGSSSPRDLETLFQLIYLNYTAPRFNEDDFEVFRTKMISNREHQANDPSFHANKRYSEVVYDGDIRHRLIDIPDLEAIQFNKYKEIHERLFSDGDNFDFTFVGNVSEEELRPLVEKYLGSLPTTSGDEDMSFIDRGVRITKGHIIDEFKVKMEQPKMGVTQVLSGQKVKDDLRSRVVASYLKAALDNQLLESAREDMGGTYGIGVNLSISSKPITSYQLHFNFDTNVEMVNDLRKQVAHELEKIARNGVAEEQIDKTREYLVKSYGNSKEKNWGWMGYINSYYNQDMNYEVEYLDLVNNVTSRDIRNLARTISKSPTNITLVMQPKEN